jgi:hypothetical protein
MTERNVASSLGTIGERPAIPADAPAAKFRVHTKLEAALKRLTIRSAMHAGSSHRPRLNVIVSASVGRAIDPCFQHPTRELPAEMDVQPSNPK